LEIGGDDYLTKPFSPRELAARVRAVFRRWADAQTAAEARTQNVQAARAQAPGARTLTHGPIRIDFERHEVRCHGERVELTPSELAVLAALIERPGVVLTRAQLASRCHTDGTVITERTIDSHVRRIRKKFETHGLEPIATVHGIGYKASGA